MKKSLINKRREVVYNYLRKGIYEKEIAKKEGVSRQTIVRDVAFLKEESLNWHDDLAKGGLSFEIKRGFDQLTENVIELNKMLKKEKDTSRRLAIIKESNETVKLKLELLSETPTIISLRKAVEKGNVRAA